MKILEYRSTYFFTGVFSEIKVVYISYILMKNKPSLAFYFTAMFENERCTTFVLLQN